MLVVWVLGTEETSLAIAMLLFVVLLLVLVVSAVAAGFVSGACGIDEGGQSSPAGTFDTVQTPPVDPSSVGPPVAAGLQTVGVVPGDAFVVPLRDRST